MITSGSPMCRDFQSSLTEQRVSFSTLCTQYSTMKWRLAPTGGPLQRTFRLHTDTDRTSWISSPLHRTIDRYDINSNPLRKTQACTCQPLGSGPLVQSRLFHFCMFLIQQRFRILQSLNQKYIVNIKNLSSIFFGHFLLPNYNKKLFMHTVYVTIKLCKYVNCMLNL